MISLCKTATPSQTRPSPPLPHLDTKVLHRSANQQTSQSNWDLDFKQQIWKPTSKRKLKLFLSSCWPKFRGIHSHALPREVIIQSPGWLSGWGTQVKKSCSGNHKTFDSKISGKSAQKLTGQAPNIPELPKFWVEVYAEARNYEHQIPLRARHGSTHQLSRNSKIT